MTNLSFLKGINSTISILTILKGLESIDINAIQTDPEQVSRTKACLQNEVTRITHMRTYYYCTNCGQLHDYSLKLLRNAARAAALKDTFYHRYALPKHPEEDSNEYHRYLYNKYLTKELKLKPVYVYQLDALSYYSDIYANKSFKIGKPAKKALKQGITLYRRLTCRL